MKKISQLLYILSIFLLIISGVTAAVSVEYSPDNVTWYNVTSIDTTNKVACQQYLNESTTYYFRGMKTGGIWEYISARTTGGQEMELAIIIGLWILTALCAAAMAYFDNELKLFFLLGTFITIVFNLNMMANLATDGGASATVTALLWKLYQIMLYVLYFIVLYVIIKIFLSLKASKKTAITTDTNALTRQLPK